MFGIETARNYIELAKANKGASVYELDIDRLRNSGKLGRLAVDKFTEEVFETVVRELGLKPEFAELNSWAKMEVRNENFTLSLGRSDGIGLMSKLDEDPLMPEESPDSVATRSYTLSSNSRTDWDELPMSSKPVGYCSRGFIELPFEDLIYKIKNDCELALSDPIKFSRENRNNAFGAGNLMVGSFATGRLCDKL